MCSTLKQYRQLALPILSGRLSFSLLFSTLHRIDAKMIQKKTSPPVRIERRRGVRVAVLGQRDICRSVFVRVLLLSVLSFRFLLNLLLLLAALLPAVAPFPCRPTCFCGVETNFVFSSFTTRSELTYPLQHQGHLLRRRRISQAKTDKEHPESGTT